METLIFPTNMNPVNSIVQENEFRPTQKVNKTLIFSASQAASINDSYKAGDSKQQGVNKDISLPKFEFQKKVLLRLGFTSTEGNVFSLENVFPPSFELTINNQKCQLPQQLPLKKGMSKELKQHGPIDITDMLTIESTAVNTVCLSWIHPCISSKGRPNEIDQNKKYCFTLMMASKLSANDLVYQVKSKGIKPPEFTKSIARDKLRDDDVEIATTSLRASLVCPLTRTKIKLPGRSIKCQGHIQCFDLQSFLSLMELKPTWDCPVCYNKIDFESLVVDGLFTEILESDRVSSTTEVQFDDVNGNIEWKPILKDLNVTVDAESPSASQALKSQPASQSAVKRKRASPVNDDVIEIIDLLSSDSDDDSIDFRPQRKKELVTSSTSSSSSSSCPETVNVASSSDEESTELFASSPLNYDTSSPLDLSFPPSSSSNHQGILTASNFIVFVSCLFSLLTHS